MKSKTLLRILFWVVLCAGLPVLFYLGGGTFSSAVLFLWTAWIGLLLTALYLFRTAHSATLSEEDPRYFAATGSLAELVREKRALVKAIKEIEFDRDTGKLSDADAAALTEQYRARAIDVLMAIDEQGSGSSATLEQEIEHRVRARLALGKNARGASNSSKESNRVSA